jgi:hypothetical protein
MPPAARGRFLIPMALALNRCRDRHEHVPRCFVGDAFFRRVRIGGSCGKRETRVDGHSNGSIGCSADRSSQGIRWVRLCRRSSTYTNRAMFLVRQTGGSRTMNDARQVQVRIASLHCAPDLETPKWTYCVRKCEEVLSGESYRADGGLNLCHDAIVWCR